MPLDTIYLTRHGHRLNWTIDHKTGTYISHFPTPTGNPADPTLTSHGVRQSLELAAHVSSPSFHPKPFRVYSSPFYRCLQTIQPTVEALKEKQQNLASGDIEVDADFDVRIENGIGEWFGPTTFFHHPSPSTSSVLQTHFPGIFASEHTYTYTYTPHIIPSTRGETIAQLHDRLAATLAAIIADVDIEIAAAEASLPPGAQRTSKAILICSHAAPLIAIGRALTGRMPADSGEEDFNVFTAGLSTFTRRTLPTTASTAAVEGEGLGSVRGDPLSLLAPGTQVARPDTTVPDWQGGKGVGGGWDCVSNGDCSFLRDGAERGWHFNGEESFDTGPMAPSSALPTSSQDTLVERSGFTKL
ncbi:hypothetical protein EYZ11_002713 [Aspergillus tanneri]|uniref:Phosphoglycerate mutase family protein n=1 Tax=Aspergillus tanneri TaxID=1220188 RepID=A0A4S3JS97_9EURO|nr:uncharacterized protein ATNIH1004_000392 [Aspergillus tanneri]KAA8651504.1 hypothetical protein ATNIH1004_000392 [Aspergillus tanneri]THC97797.1 hypothetical protein EYZ11_002713 [Aspergillus tanneri]